METANIVVFTCPECNGKVTVSYNQANGQFSDYHEESVPHLVANSIVGNTVYCPQCGDRFVVMFDINAAMVPLFLRKN